MPGPQELLVIAVIALLVFGPDRLPELARNAAKLLDRVRSETDKSVGELKRAAAAEGLDREWREISDDLRDTRDRLRAPLRPDRDRKPVSAPVGGGSGPVWREDDDPPPVDAEAT